MSMQLLNELFPDMAVTGFHDNYPNLLDRSEIDVSLDWLEKRLGKRISDEIIVSKLKRLGFETSIKGDTIHVIAPTWRSTGDVSIPDDIMEEVARMYGFEHFEPTPINAIFEGAINQLEVDVDRKVREYLACRCGMQEVFTYPWVSDDYINAVLTSNECMLELSAPPSPNEKFLKSTLVPNLCKAAADNLRFYDEFAIFESAQVFFDRDYSSMYDSREKLPYQRRHVAGVFVGNPEDLDSLFKKTKGVIEALPRYTHIEPFELSQIDKPVWADNVVWLNISHAGELIGCLALLSKKVALDCGIKNSAVMLFELDVDSLKPYLSRTNKFIHIPEYPMTDYDMSLLFDLSVSWKEMYEVITGKMGPDTLIRDVIFIEEYTGKQVPDGKKSVTIRLVIGSLKKTLTSEEIEGCASAVVKRLNKTIGAELRKM